MTKMLEYCIKNREDAARNKKRRINCAAGVMRKSKISYARNSDEFPCIAHTIRSEQI